jgi:hypothetical protein
LKLKDLQPANGEKSYAEIGGAFDPTEQAMKNAAHRFRRRYAELLRDEIAQTVDTPAEVEAEVQHPEAGFSRADEGIARTFAAVCPVAVSTSLGLKGNE